MKKNIKWNEKRGKGSYFDPKLNHFISTMPGFDNELQLAKEASYTPKQTGMKKIIINIQKMFIKLGFNMIEWCLKQDLPEEKRKQMFDRLLKMKDKLEKK